MEGSEEADPGRGQPERLFRVHAFGILHVKLVMLSDDHDISQGGLVPEGELRKYEVTRRVRGQVGEPAHRILQSGNHDSHAHEADTSGFLEECGAVHVTAVFLRPTGSRSG